MDRKIIYVLTCILYIAHARRYQLSLESSRSYHKFKMRPVYTILLLGLYCICGLTVFMVLQLKTPHNCPQELAFGDTCKNPRTLAKGLRHFADISPLYEVFTLNASYAPQVDNICYTFFHIDLTSYLIFKSVVFHNDTGEVIMLFQSEISNRPGVFRAASKPGITDDVCTFQEHLLGRYNCSDTHEEIYYFYTCFLHGDCKRVHRVQDMRHGVSPTRPDKLKNVCVKLALSDLKMRSLDFLGRIFITLPNRLRKRCVTTYHGALAINADKVSEEDELVYP